MSPPRPPRLARLLLRVFVRGDDAEFVLGDLDEEYGRLVAQLGRAHARRWFWRHAVSTAGRWSARAGSGSLEAWGRDVRHAGRGLWRAPAYSVIAVASLSLGFAGVAAVAALSESILRPLPYPESNRLVAVWESKSGERRWVAPANYLDWRGEAESFEELAAFDTRGASITLDDGAIRSSVAVVSGNIFSTLRVEAALGRTFDPRIDVAFGSRVAVISYPAWVDAFGAPSDVVGRTFRVDDLTYEVIGVAPRGLTFPDPDLFAWLRSPNEAPELRDFGGDLTRMRDAHYFQVVGRLREGRSLASARAEMASLAVRLERSYPDTNQGSGVELVPLHEQAVGDATSTLLSLGFAVLLVLLAAAVNVTHLTLARSTARAGEMAVKVSIGASRGDVHRFAIAEGALVGSAGGALGVVGATWGLGSLDSLTASLPRAGDLAVQPIVPALVLGLSIVIGAAIARFASGVTNADGKPITSMWGATTKESAIGRSMIALQVAAAIALLAGTGLMARSVRALAAVDLGFEARGLVTFRVAIPDARVRSHPERVNLLREVETELAAHPGVSDVGFGSNSPLETGVRAGVFLVGGPRPLDPPNAGWQPVSPGHLDALAVSLVRGRTFSDADGPEATDVAIVNETFVRTILAGGEPLGAQVTMGLDGHERPLAIVGVVRDTRTEGPASPAQAVLYRPFAQADRFPVTSAFFAVRTASGAGPGASEVRALLREVAPGLPVYSEASGAGLSAPFRSSRTALLQMLAVFAATALALGLVGVYGVASFSVRRRRREIGVRLALGADGGRVVREVVGRGMRMALFGVPVGIGLAVLLGRTLERVLFEVPASDPAMLAGITLLVLMATAGALLVPASRAARTDPATATREG